MTGFILRRLLAGAVLVLVISFLSYLLIAFAQPNTARELLGMSASQHLVDAKNHELGLDQPVLVRYWHWLVAATHGDLGRSWFTDQSVASSIWSRLPVTLSLVLGVTVVTAVAAFVLGIWAAVRPGLVDRAVQLLGVVGYALPGFLVTLLVVLVFAVHLGWFPAVGYVGIDTSWREWLSSITLPVIALSVGAVAGVSQQVRGSVLEVLRQDYIRTLAARGLSPTRIMLRHVLRNAAGPALSVLGLQFVALLGGAAIVEQIFALPGIGSMTVQYTGRGDVPMVMGLVMITVVGVVLVNLVIDVVIGWLNPKVRLG